MGAAESRSLTSNAASPAIRGRIGFHVLRVADNSPAAIAGIEPYFDYIVGVDETPLTASMAGGTSKDTTNVEELLARVVDEREGTKLSLQIWSSKRAELRDVIVIPSRQWSSNPRATANGDDSQQEVSLDEAQPSLLGLSLRLCNPDGALENVWHVLEILGGSPAESAGLVPFGDYILGYSGGVLHKESDFYKLIEEHVDKSLRLFVYNSDFDVTREVVIIPNRAWSQNGTEEMQGGGLLGCGVGYGVLHRIPKPQNRTQPTVTPSVEKQPISPPRAAQQQQPPPKRMTASIAPATPPKPSQSTFKTGLSGSPNRNQGYVLNQSPLAPPRSPRRASSPRPDMIREEEETLA